MESCKNLLFVFSAAHWAFLCKQPSSRPMAVIVVIPPRNRSSSSLLSLFPKMCLKNDSNEMRMVLISVFGCWSLLKPAKGAASWNLVSLGSPETEIKSVSYSLPNLVTHTLSFPFLFPSPVFRHSISFLSHSCRLALTSVPLTEALCFGISFSHSSLKSQQL